MNESLKLLSQVLPQLAIIAALCGFIGWSLRGRSQKPAETVAKTKPREKGSDRVKNLETTLEKSKAAHKALKAELEELQSSSVSRSELDAAKAELEASRLAGETESRKISSLEAELKKAQETIRHLNARGTEANKAEKDRNFALENELSKTRQQLAILQERPDDTATLQAEIERLRESVAVSTRYAGEVRKRESAAIEALEKAQARIDQLSDPSRPAPVSNKVGPVVDSGRIAAAKAEVLRILEQNKQRTVETSREDALVEPTEEFVPATAELEETLDAVTEVELSGKA